MKRLTAPYRFAKSEDAPNIAELFNIASHGLSLYLWAKLAGTRASPWDVGRERAGCGIVAYRNTIVREAGGRIAACLNGRALRDSPQANAHEEVPIMLAPMHELENIVHETWFVNLLATYPEHRRKGYGTELLHIAEMLAHDAQCTRLSLVVSDANTGALRLYEQNGYVEHATRSIVKEKWEHLGNNWGSLYLQLLAI